MSYHTWQNAKVVVTAHVRKVMSVKKSNIEGPVTVQSKSRLLSYTIPGEHIHTITGYSLLKGLGNDQPVASEPFTVAGFDWVLLFYPDGLLGTPSVASLGLGYPRKRQCASTDDSNLEDINNPGPIFTQNEEEEEDTPAEAAAAGQAEGPGAQPGAKKAKANTFASVFVALIGERFNAQGVLNLRGMGRLVRVYHTFSLVNQIRPDNKSLELTRGRDHSNLKTTAARISCDYHIPGAMSWHGYRKFVGHSVLENKERGFLVDDKIVIKYNMEVVVTTLGDPQKPEPIQVPPSVLNKDLAALLESGRGTDFIIECDGEEFAVHRMILEARSPFFRGMLESSMTEAQAGRYVVKDVIKPVMRVLLQFIYTDDLPEDVRASGLDLHMAQHLMAAAEMYQMTRLRRICEQRLLQTVDLDNAATTLALAEQSHSELLKDVCMELLARNLPDVINTDGYKYLISSCPGLQAELLQTVTAPIKFCR